jgi:hypothetical protein
MAGDFRPRSLLALLAAHRVEFVVVGGIAAVLHGSDRNTFDLDICPSQDRDNLERLGTALLEIGAKLRGIEDDVPFVPDGRSLAGMEILTLDTTLGPLDILVSPKGCPPYAKLQRRAKQMDIGGPTALIASIDDLISMKRSADRDKDQFDIEALETIKAIERRLKRRSRQRAG